MKINGEFYGWKVSIFFSFSFCGENRCFQWIREPTCAGRWNDTYNNSLYEKTTPEKKNGSPGRKSRFCRLRNGQENDDSGNWGSELNPISIVLFRETSNAFWEFFFFFLYSPADIHLPLMPSELGLISLGNVVTDWTFIIFDFFIKYLQEEKVRKRN